MRKRSKVTKVLISVNILLLFHFNSTSRMQNVLFDTILNRNMNIYICIQMLASYQMERKSMPQAEWYTLNDTLKRTIFCVIATWLH